MFELKCPNCGGKLVAEEDQVRAFDGVVMVRSGKKLTCNACGADFERGDELNLFGSSTTVVTGDGNIVVGNVSSSSGVVIGRGTRVAFNQVGQRVKSQVNIRGNVVVGGDIVGGDRVTIVTGYDNDVRW